MNALAPSSAPAAVPATFFPRRDGSRIPYEVFTSQAIYEREQEHIYRGPTWSFVGLEAEVPNRNDFKSTFVGDTPVVLARTDDGSLAAWVNRCAHRGAMVCRRSRGNAATTPASITSGDTTRRPPAGRAVSARPKAMTGMPPDFDRSNGLRKLRVDSYAGLVFATFSDAAASLADYIGAVMGR